MADITEATGLNEKILDEYDASQIQVLEGLEAVRKRPKKYIDPASTARVVHDV